MVLQALEHLYDDGQVRLLCPPVNLIMATMNKLAQKHAPAILLIPDWSRQAWQQAALRLFQHW